MMYLLRHWMQRRRHPERYAQLQSLLSVQRQSRQQLLQRQARDFDELVRFAVDHTDFYSTRFDAHLAHRGRLPGPADLPILEKQDVIDHLDGLLVRDADRTRVKVGHTGGSTGIPLAFYYDDAKHELMLAGMMRGFMMSGWRPGQKILYFWGASRDVAPGGVFGSAHNGFLSAEKSIPAVAIGETRLHQWVRTIRTWRPTLLYGYASVLGELARYVVEQGIRLPGSLLGVYSTAEVLGDGQRQLMQQAFGCKVFDQYGCREVPNIAWECRHGNMHVFSDLVCLESVRMGDQDRLLVTSLSNRLMPFIRYNLGDSGRLLDGECPCGLPFPLMEMGVCRQNDLIRNRAGQRFHPAYFNRLLYGLRQIRRYQWVQRGRERLELNLVAAQRLSQTELDSIEAGIRRDVDKRMRVVVNYVDDIPRSDAGKHRFVIGMVDGPAQR